VRQAKLDLSNWFENPIHLKPNQQSGTELPMRRSNPGCEAEGKERSGRKQRLRGILSKAEGY